MTRLIMIRHGETNWNVEQRKQGRNDQPLNEKGQAQASLASRYVETMFDIAKVWSSPLQRCAKTAADLGLPVSTSDHLLEIDYGDWEGMLESDINARHPDRYQNGGISMDPPRGEKRSNLPVRARKWIQESHIADEKGDVVLVGHGTAMRGLLVALLGLPDHAMENFVIYNCSVTTVQIEPGINRLATLNYTAHLTSANGT